MAASSGLTEWKMATLTAYPAGYAAACNPNEFSAGLERWSGPAAQKHRRHGAAGVGEEALRVRRGPCFWRGRGPAGGAGRSICR
jgi:hypothetical protein